MRHFNSQLIVMFGALLGLTGAIGGCPTDTATLDLPAAVTAPGAYYVEQREGKLYYLQLPDVRGEESTWVPLDDDGTWFDGPGLYRVDEDMRWSINQESAAITSDELIQLHDPAPSAGL